MDRYHFRTDKKKEGEPLSQLLEHLEKNSADLYSWCSFVSALKRSAEANSLNPTTTALEDRARQQILIITRPILIERSRQIWEKNRSIFSKYRIVIHSPQEKLIDHGISFVAQNILRLFTDFIATSAFESENTRAFESYLVYHLDKALQTYLEEPTITTAFMDECEDTQNDEEDKQDEEKPEQKTLIKLPTKKIRPAYTVGKYFSTSFAYFTEIDWILRSPYLTAKDFATLIMGLILNGEFFLYLENLKFAVTEHVDLLEQQITRRAPILHTNHNYRKKTRITISPAPEEHRITKSESAAKKIMRQEQAKFTALLADLKHMAAQSGKLDLCFGDLKLTYEFVGTYGGVAFRVSKKDWYLRHKIMSTKITHIKKSLNL